jgi:hypothetical protein
MGLSNTPPPFSNDPLTDIGDVSLPSLIYPDGYLDSLAPPYLDKVAYFFHSSGSSADLNTLHKSEAQRAPITDTSLSLCHGGVYVQLLTRDVGSSSNWTNIRFQPRVPADEAVSGDQPLLTGIYPYVILPAEKPIEYGIGILINPSENQNLGIQKIECTIRVPGSTYSKDQIGQQLRSQPDLLSGYEEEIVNAVEKFGKGDKNYGPIPEGEYKITLWAQVFPIINIRYDGGMPLVKTDMAAESSIFSRNYDFKSLLRTANRFNPFNDRNFGNSTCFETPTAVGILPEEMLQITDEGTTTTHSGLQGPFIFSEVQTKNPLGAGNKLESRQQLIYQPQTRTGSIQTSAANPNQGLIEVQIDLCGKPISVEVDYTPMRIETNPSSLPLYLMGEQSKAQSYGNFFFSTLPVNTGRTELGEPRIGSVAPTTSCNWIGHLSTFRFVLTNGWQ